MRRAAEEGLTVTAYVSRLLRRSFERIPGEESVLAYDHIDDGGELRIDREADEDDESYERRCALCRNLFSPSAPIPKFASLGDILWCELRNPEVH